MKKFSERSGTGQRRIVVVCSGLVCVLVLTAVLIFDKSGMGAINSFVDSMQPISQTPAPGFSPTPYVKPTAIPDVTSGVVPNITQKPDMHTAEEVLSGFLHYVLNEEFPYDGSLISKESLMVLAGIEQPGERISVDEVTPGDIGVFGEHVCVCIGYDEQGLALFSYAVPYSTAVLTEGGIYFGYSMEQKDALYCGMYPVPCEEYYNCADGEYASISLAEKSEKARNVLASGYSEDVYTLGRMVSSGNCDFVMNAFPEQVLKKYGLIYDESFLLLLLSKFNVRAGAEEAGAVYAFVQDGSTYRLSNKAFCMDVKLICLDTGKFLSEHGGWTLEVTDDYGLRLIPSFLLSNYAGVAFVRAADTIYHYDEEGNVTDIEYVKTENNQGTVVEHEDGSKTYHGTSYQITVDGDTVLTESVQGEAVFDLGDMRYLLVSKSGVSFEYDLSEYSDFPQEVIDAMIRNELEKLCGSEAEE